MRQGNSSSAALTHLGLFGLLLALLAGRHLYMYMHGVQTAHLGLLASSLAQMAGGDWWVAGPRLWFFDLPLTSPLYYWLHAPVLLFRNPITGLHVVTFALEALALAGWCLIGLRAGLGRGLVFASAACLALYQDGIVLAENMTVAGFFAAPLLMACLAALTTGSRRLLALAGALLGLTLQVHPLAMMLLPGLLLALAWLPRGERLRGAAAALAGCGAVQLPILIQLLGTDAGQWQPVAESFSRWDPASISDHVSQVPIDLLALAGLAVAGARALRRRWLAPPEALGGLWLLLGGILTLLALSFLRPTVDEEYRYAMIKPARALLGALFLSWLARSIGAAGIKLLRGKYAAAAGWAVALGFGAALALASAPGGSPGAPAGALTREQICELEYLPRITRISGLAMEEFLDRAGDRAATGSHHFWGTWSEELNAALWLMEGGAARDGGPMIDSPERLPILVLPRTATLDRLASGSAGRPAGISYLPGAALAAVQSGDDRRRFKVPLAPGPAAVVDLVVRARTHDPATTSLRLTGQGQASAPLAQCRPCGVEPRAMFGYFRVKTPPRPGWVELEVRSEDDNPSVEAFVVEKRGAPGRR